MFQRGQRLLPDRAAEVLSLLQRSTHVSTPARAPQVIKLSDAVQPLPRQATQYVHGAPQCFLAIGDDCSHETADDKPHFTKGAYTLGKMVWGKVRPPPWSSVPCPPLRAAVLVAVCLPTQISEKVRGREGGTEERETLR